MAHIMLTWTPLPKDLQFSIYNTFEDMDWFYKFFFNEIILPAKDPKLEESFTDFFNHIEDACTVYDAVNEEVLLIEEMIDKLNQLNGDTDEFKKTLSLLTEIIHDLNVTYLNICLFISNEVFQFIPTENLSNEERITELNAMTEKLFPLIRGMVIEKSHFDKYMLELIFLQHKLINN